MPVDFNGPLVKVAFSKMIAPLADKDISRRADDVVESAIAAVPLGETLGLVGSIHKEKILNGYKVVADAKNYKGYHYGYYVEIGYGRLDGTKIAGRPYLLPALEAAKD